MSYNYISIFHFFDGSDYKTKKIYFKHNGKNDCFQMYSDFCAKHNFMFMYRKHETYTREQYNELYNGREKQMNIIKITVELSNNGHTINYYIDTKNGTRECYIEKTVPVSVVELMNKNACIYHEKKRNGNELFVYRP